MKESTGAAARRRPPQATAAPTHHAPNLTLNERLVRERDRDRARELARTLALGILVLMPLLLYVWQQVAFMETAYRVEELRTERDRLERLLGTVQLERASLEALDRIDSLARERLGMLQPPPESVFTVRPSPPAGVSGAPATGEAR